MQEINRDDDTCVHGINGRTKQKFNMLWIRRPFVYDWQTNSLWKHLTNWTSTEMCNYHRLIVSPIDSPAKKKKSSHYVTQHVRIQNLTLQGGHNRWQNEITRLQKFESNSLPWNLRNSTFPHCEKYECSNKREGRLGVKFNTQMLSIAFSFLFPV